MKTFPNAYKFEGIKTHKDPIDTNISGGRSAVREARENYRRKFGQSVPATIIRWAMLTFSIGQSGWRILFAGRKGAGNRCSIERFLVLLPNRLDLSQSAIYWLRASDHIKVEQVISRRD